MPEPKTKPAGKRARRPAAASNAAREPASGKSGRVAQARVAQAKAVSDAAPPRAASHDPTPKKAAPKKKGLVHAVRTRVSGKKTNTGFGGYRKRTMTAREFIGSLYSLAPQAPMIYQIWGKQELDPGFREELMLAVAKLNDCRYCTWGHHEWAYLSGVPEEELAHIENMDPAGFDRSKWVAISYVRALVSANYGEVSPELLQELKEHFGPHEIEEIELVARVMDIANRGANTWDAMLSRIRGNPANDSHLLDEIVMSGVFWSAAPMVVLLLARESKRPFREVWRSMVDYVAHYEERDTAA